jgi:uncharacterized protein
MKLSVLGLVLAAVLALPAAAATPDTRTITVIGNGEAEPESAPGEWTLVVSVDNERARTALRSATAAVTRVQAALRAAGMTDFHTDRVAIAARTAPDENASFRGFVASTEIEFTIADTHRAAVLLDRVRALGVAAIYGPTPAEGTSQELEQRALADGMDDAVEKARRLAAKAGVTLGPAVTIEERRQESPYPVVLYGPGGPLSRLAPSDDVYASVTVTFAVS